MALIVPIGDSVRTALASCAKNGWLENVHPGLVLDKFPLTYDPDNEVDWSKDVQHPSAEQVVRLSGSPPAGFPFADFLRRWKSVTAGGVTFSATTIGPLTLHLARASALENAGICLHPLYGFAYLPGSGLKGMARAYAETIWLPTQMDQKQAWRKIEDVFGWAPSPDRRQQINDPNHPAKVRRRDDNDPESPEIKASSGNIVFHDAWPESWPRLIVDIVNNHHPEYYRAAPDDNDHAPGDWENPVPVYFLAVSPGVTFTFPLARRRGEVADELLDLARQWLLGGVPLRLPLTEGVKAVA
ncbi:MAG: type III-B CRISPR module RAMP protein Cmr6 [Gemmataceae bacterium]|nr:type III-B CRISPR module RAMP protein Cmr6 [Gemmataceae bacterium]